MKWKLSQRPQENNHAKSICYAASKGWETEVRRLLQSTNNPILQDERNMSALHWAAWEGQLNIVSLLSKYDPRMISHRDIYGRVPLDCAAENNQTEAAKALVHITKVDIGDNQQRTALHWSVQNSNEQICDHLLAGNFAQNPQNAHRDSTSLQEAQLARGETSAQSKYTTWVDSQTTIFGDTALHLAVARHDSRVVSSLLQMISCDVSLKNHGGKTAFEIAILRGQKLIAKNLLLDMVWHRVGGNFESSTLDFLRKWPDSDQNWNIDVLCWAASNGFEKVVTTILDTRINIECYSRMYKRTALQAAAGNYQYNMVKLLLARRARVNAPPMESHGRTALQAAAEQGDLEMTKLLLSYGSKDAQINAMSAQEYGRTALQAATEQGHVEMVKFLLSQGPKDTQINAPPAKDTGLTALQAAVQQGNLEMVKLLLSQGYKEAQINAPPAEYNGSTALQAAAGRGCIEMVQFLLANKAEINAPGVSGSGMTALGAAVSRGHIEIIDIFLRGNAIVNMEIQDGSGLTALHLAAENGSRAIVERLIQARAGMNTKDKFNRTALDIARQRGRTEVVEFLEMRLREAGGEASSFV